MIHPVETIERVRYCETDRMGYFHHANYPVYFEIGRTEWLRNLGISYKSVEDNGIVMPVAEMKIKYHQPAFYDDLILLRTYLLKKPTVRISFITDIYRKNSSEHLCTGEVTLAFVNKESGKLVRKVPFLENLSF
jgi:acyl-CoA thioester hydrolase